MLKLSANTCSVGLQIGLQIGLHIGLHNLATCSNVMHSGNQ